MNQNSSLPTVSIVIVNFNQAELLKKCLLAVQKVNYPSQKLEVIVVDNHSTDSSAELVFEHFPKVKLIEASQNFGFAEGCNQGVAVARGEIIVLLNNDTEVDKDWLTPLINRLQSDPKIGAVNSKTLIRQDDKDYIQNAGNLLFKDGYGRDRGAVVSETRQQTYEEDSEYWQQPVEVAAFCGVSVAIPKKLFLKLGGFDATFFAYYEDTDLSMMLQRMDYQIWYEPKSQLLHRHSASSKEWSPFFIYHTEKNRLALIIKHFPFNVLLIELYKYCWQLKKTILAAVLKKRTWSLVKTRLTVVSWVILNFIRLYKQRQKIDQMAKISMDEVWTTLY